MKNVIGLGLVLLVLTSSLHAEEENLGEKIKQTKVTITLEKATVRQLVELITEKVGLNLMAPDKILDNPETFTVRVKDLPVRKLMHFLSDAMNLRMQLDAESKTLFVKFKKETKKQTAPPYAPELQHHQALQIINHHPQITGLRNKYPELRTEVEWDDKDRCWEADLKLKGKKIGDVKLGEYGNGKHTIIEVDIDDPADKNAEKKKPAEVNEAEKIQF